MTPAHGSNTIMSADDTKVIGLIKNNDNWPTGRMWIFWMRLTSFKFLEFHKTSPNNYCSNLLRKASQRLFLLRTLRKIHSCRESLFSFYRCTIKSILSSNQLFPSLVWTLFCLGSESIAGGGENHSAHCRSLPSYH